MSRLEELLKKWTDLELGKVGHQDPERSAVSITARAVAAARAIETEKGDKALVIDPYARDLAGPGEGLEWFKNFARDNIPSLVDKTAVRTRYIDDQIVEATKSPIRQLVIVGAGLDARAFRMESLKDFVVIEIDFPEVFQYKRKALKDAQPACKTRCEVSVDLSLPSWSEEFLKATSGSFDATKPTFWLLEGLIGYLTEQEATTLFTTIRSLSAPNSKLLATVVGANSTEHTTMHKFFTNDAPELLLKCGWSTASQRDAGEIAEQYKANIARTPGVYWFAQAAVN